MSNLRNIPRHQRKQIKRLVRTGKLPLKVVGSQDSGFKLAAQRGDNLINLFGQSSFFRKQSSAILRGNHKFGQTAVKRLLNGAKRARQPQPA